MLYVINIKRKLLPLFLSLFIVGCSSNYKEEISLLANGTLLELQQGNISVLPGYSSYSETLSEELLNQLKNSFKQVTTWDLAVSNIDDNGLVNVNVDLIFADRISSTVFQYKKIDNIWTLQEEVQLTKKIDSVTK